jgi:urease accessory protein
MKLTRPALTALSSLTLLAPSVAWAHAGHGGSGFLPGFLHPFLGLDHVLTMIAVGVWAAQLGGRALWAVPTAFTAAMALGGALGYFGVSIPLTELLIATSVLLLGLLVSLGVRLPVTCGVLLVAVFAPFHGAAHAAEAPALTSFVTYATGFLLATAFLHAAGLLAAIAVRARPAMLRLAAAPVALAGAWLLVSRIG